jgi:hypothetical protein
VSEEAERGRREALAHLSEIDVVRVRRSELIRMRSLVENFLQVNPNNKIGIMNGITEIDRHTVIHNLEDVEFVLGYLRGLT